MARSRLIFVNRVYRPDQSATAQLLTDLTEELGARGHEVHVITSGRDHSDQPGNIRIHRTGGTASRHGLVPRAWGYLHFLHAAKQELRRLVRAGDVVILKTDPPLLSVHLTGLCRERSATVVHWIQDIYPEIAQRHAGRWLEPCLRPLRSARDRAWRAARFCVPVGEDMAGFVRARGVPAERVRMLPNWAPRELAQPAPAEEVAARRAALGWTGRFVLAYSGNLGRVHEFKTLLDSAELLSADETIRLAFIGTGARHAEIERAARARHLRNVEFLPAQPRAALAASLAAADVHAVTLLPGHEALVHPSKVAGILAAARPLVFVGPPQCALVREVREAGCVACFAPGDSAGLAGAIRGWREDDASRLAAGVAARSLYERRYRFEESVQQWEQLLLAIAL